MKAKRMGKEGCAHSNSARFGEPCNVRGDARRPDGAGEAVIRFKGDMQSENSALRDPTILRVKREQALSTGNKYKVWPLYDLNTPYK